MSSLPPPDPDFFIKGLIVLIVLLVLYSFLTNGMRVLEERNRTNVQEYMFNSEKTNSLK